MFETRYTLIEVMIEDGKPYLCWMYIEGNDSDAGYNVNLDVLTAQKLMWELKLAGGTRRIAMSDNSPKSYNYSVSLLSCLYT